MQEIIGSFICGVAFGASALMGLSMYLLNRDKKKLQDPKKQAEDFLSKVNEKIKKESNSVSVKERLNKAADIGARQLELIAQAQAPSMNSLHSKFKNDLISEVKLLEDEKRALLRSIIKDGSDPKLTVTNSDGTKEVIKLSEYMVQSGIPLEVPEAVPPMPEGARSVKNGRFFVIEGGKGEGTTH